MSTPILSSSKFEVDHYVRQAVFNFTPENFVNTENVKHEKLSSW